MTDIRSWDAWNETHQPFELDWWRKALKGGHSVDTASFRAHWAPVKDFIKPFGRVIDIGCGPRPPFAPCTAIEPLGAKYQDMTPAGWWENVHLISQPAELLVDGLAGDTVICWNAIDHAHGWRAILANMATYAHLAGPESRVAIATDFHPPFVGHPGFDRDDFMAEIAKRFDIVEAREPLDGQGRAWEAVMKVKGP